VNNYYHQIGFCTGVALTLLAAQSSEAATKQITGVQLNPNTDGVELRLTTSGKESNSSFFTVKGDNTLEANLLNTELNLPTGTSFNQENPFPGIAKVAIKQLDKHHTQIAIATEDGVPVEQVLQQQGKDLVLNLTPEKQKFNPFHWLAQRLTGEEKTYTPPASNPNVLVPNPEINITENGSNSNEIVQSVDSTEPTLPRAVAPPVGDISISNINATPDFIDLGSSVLVPRLVLRDAPVREVLSLLARSAGLNLVFTNTQAAAEGTEGEQPQEQTISLDLENEPVQDVFNSVLLVSGLNANRQGTTIYVGKTLPDQARNLISRTLRLNQVKVSDAAAFLATFGAETQIYLPATTTTKTEATNVNGIVSTSTSQTTTPPTITALSAAKAGGSDQSGEGGLSGAFLLKGLSVSSDDRLNSITLIGEPRTVEVATAYLTQLDARRRQVAINVKVLDVNLRNQDIFNSSFSFGINDSFFVQDRGSAILNFGDTAPPNVAQVTGSQFSPTVIPLTVGGATLEPFFDIQENAPFSDITSGSSDFTGGISPYARPNFGTNSNPFQPGVSDIDVDDDGVEFEYTLPQLFQFPKQFLSRLQAQVTSGNAKILTDPTLVVQEGQVATVKLVQEVITSVKTEIDSESGFRTITPVIGEAGLRLAVNLERIDDNGFIALRVDPIISSIGGTQEFDSGGGATNLLNLLSKRELSSGLIRLRDGQTLILSGIIQDQERTTISKVPILGDIPLLGSLFRSNDKTNERNEVIVMLTPEVIDEQSGFGYNYTPSKDAREFLQQRGFNQPVTP
jgi:type IV pilus assembly protein PilQ